MLKVEVITQTNYHYLFGGIENRIAGLFDDDGSSPVFSSYLLGAEKSVTGVFPLANILHRPVQRKGMHQADAAIITSFNWYNWNATIGYGLFGRQGERLTLDEWPANTYAVVSPLYTTGAAFTNSVSTAALDEDFVVLLNHRFLTSDMINLTPATSPAQSGLSLTASIGCTANVYTFPVGFGAGFTYEHGLTNATISTLTGWIKGLISF